MDYVEWEVKAREFVNCNCAYGCPCQFNALPTHGFCEAIMGLEIYEGFFGDLRLDGLRAAGTLKWPGPIHEGNGEVQLFIDDQADEAQREALIKILSGEETDPGSTVWNVFASTMITAHDPVFTTVDFAVDIEKRTASLKVNGVIETSGEPIRNPVTGEEHRARINLPDGFEYEIAEMGSGTTRATGAVALEFTDSYGQFADIHLSTHGPVRG